MTPSLFWATCDGVTLLGYVYMAYALIARALYIAFQRHWNDLIMIVYYKESKFVHLVLKDPLNYPLSIYMYIYIYIYRHLSIYQSINPKCTLRQVGPLLQAGLLEYHHEVSSGLQQFLVLSTPLWLTGELSLLILEYK